ncbi:tetratricopeptide repeat protein [Solimonas soli]|uniref:tetratricopeptide repeat protein n=1 Tax=Solimonas soli TaxID=413479 RepID=UPI000488B2C0|nr:tetratricopeptide repeat protein [Solimonas soli]
MNSFRKAALTAVFAGGIALAPLSFAANVAQDAQALIDAGKASEALSKLDDHLAKNPQDAEARFTKGLALVKLGRSRDAIRVFADLTRDYPQLPEPYNNLAVLYAAQGEYDKARDALQAAVVKHPGYATAHENLGDIYAALAGAAYGKAAALDAGNQGVRRKLAVINQLDTGLDAAVAPQPVAAAAAAAPPSAAPVAAPAKAAEAPKSAESEARHSAAIGQVNAWAKAWASKDLDAYFALYAPEFTPEGGISRETWQAQRRDRIEKPKHIAVRVDNPQATDIEDGAVRVSFRQVYESDSFKDSVSKVLELVPVNGSWLIVREYTR